MQYSKEGLYKKEKSRTLGLCQNSHFLRMLLQDIKGLSRKIGQPNLSEGFPQ